MADVVTSSPGEMAEKGTATIIAGTPPTLRRTIEFDSLDNSDIDELNDERIPATSPFVTQPTQLITQPTQIIAQRTTLRRRESSPQFEKLVSSSPPPRPPIFQKSKDTMPTKDQSISRFFKRSLPVSPKMVMNKGSNGPPKTTVSTIPTKRQPLLELIEISDSDEDDFGGRSDIKPTAFARKVSIGRVSDTGLHPGWLS
jgi:hypothetical protein